MRGRAYFVTGTDTGVGKTWVSAEVLRAWRRRGLRVAGLKAAESGGMSGGDDETLFQAAGEWQAERCRYRFDPAVAPGVAADDEGVHIDFDVIAEQVRRLREQADRVLVEGAGGWLVPMGQGRTIATLAAALGLDVIVVGRGGLGTINHSALTVRAIEAEGLMVAGVALSVMPDEHQPFVERNRLEIEGLTGVRVVVMRAGDVERAVDELGV